MNAIGDDDMIYEGDLYPVKIAHHTALESPICSHPKPQISEAAVHFCHDTRCHCSDLSERIDILSSNAAIADISVKKKLSTPSTRTMCQLMTSSMMPTMVRKTWWTHQLEITVKCKFQKKWCRACHNVHHLLSPEEDNWMQFSTIVRPLGSIGRIFSNRKFYIELPFVAYYTLLVAIP